MIVVDENIHNQRIIASIASWYPGQVVSVTTLRPGTIIKDDAIPALLLRVSYPTFVTINATDFWREVEPHGAYCVITIALSKERIPEIPDLLRRLFRIPDFKTRALRMGKVLRLTLEHVEYYEADWRVRSLTWPE